MPYSLRSRINSRAAGACDRCGYGPMTIERSVHRDMVLLPGGTFRMGSDCHYPEETPAHRVAVSSFLINRTLVTNGQFRAFVDATGYVTVAEVAPDAKDYPGAGPDILKPGTLVLTSPSREVDLCHWSHWWRFEFGANWRWPYGLGRANRGMEERPRVHVAYQDAAEFAWGDEFMPGGRHIANTWQGAFPRDNFGKRWLHAHAASGGISAQRVRLARHDRQRLGVDARLVRGRARNGCIDVVLHPGTSSRRARGRQL